MWIELFINYGAFLLKFFTIIFTIFLLVMLFINLSKNAKFEATELKLENLKDKYKNLTDKLKQYRLTEAEIKYQAKQKKKEEKQKKKEEKQQIANTDKQKQLKPCVYVLTFKGDMVASQVSNLREEINTILSVADPAIDEILLKLESPGGLVHAYGLAASQLARLTSKGFKLRVVVDTVAASGGYMMACVASEVIAAPFAIIGSVGVVAQVPNIHRLLKKHDIDVDVMTAGEYKRTVTLLGEKTKKGMDKLQKELELTHQLFKDFIMQHRNKVDINKISTGEHWFGIKALELNLIDRIATSDDLILEYLANNDIDIIDVKLPTKKNLLQKIAKQTELSSEKLINKILFNNNNNLY